MINSFCMGEDLISKLEADLKGAIDIVSQDLAVIRTGRAKPSLVENLKIEAYGSRVEMREVASISVPDSSLIVISPWDKSLVEAIQKSIRDSDLNLNPMVDGSQIKVPIPMLTEERRMEFVKQVAQKVESGKVLVRQIRGDTKDEIEKLEGQPGVSEDDIKRWLEEMQGVVDEYAKEIEEMGSDKEKELMTI